MAGVELDTPGHFQPVHAGHLDIGQDHARLEAVQQRQRLLAGAGGPHVVTLVSQ